MKPDRRSSTNASIPTSSMADIAFLLIIFFMVTSVFAATKGLELSLPDDDTEPIGDETTDSVFIHVRADRVLVDCRPMPVHEIPAYLEPILQRNPSKPVILYTASEAEYRKMVEVYDELAASPSLSSNVFVPTRSDLEDYAKTFGGNPLENACP